MGPVGHGSGKAATPSWDSDGLFSSSSKSGSPAMRTRPGIFPTLVSSKNCKTAGVARGSLERRRTEGALLPEMNTVSYTLDMWLVKSIQNSQLKNCRTRRTKTN